MNTSIFTNAISNKATARKTPLAKAKKAPEELPYTALPNPKCPIVIHWSVITTKEKIQMFSIPLWSKPSKRRRLPLTNLNR